MEWVTAWRAPWLTPVMRALTLLGDEMFFLIALPPLYWLWRRTAGARLGFVFLATVVVNAVLKESWQVERPPPPRLTTADGYSFPSGHSQIGAAFWGWLAIEVRRTWFTVVAVALVAGIMLSRVYLGAHWPRDVVAGAGFGLIGVGLGLLCYEAGFGRRLMERSPLLVAAAVLPIVALALWVDDLEYTAMKSAAALAGVWAGAVWVEARGLPALGPSWRARLAGLALGFAGLAVVYAGLKAALVALALTGPVAGFVRYLLVGAWVSALAPWLFVRLGLASKALSE